MQVKATSPRISILTATYNRAKTLARLAESLEAQAFHDFEWLVVDDGSIDDTEAVLEGFAASGRLPLRVMRIENGGKHRALNRGMPELRGEWTFIVDSDDILPPDALAKISCLADASRGEENLCGIMGLKGDLSGAIIGGLLPEGLGPVDSASLTFTWNIRGDKAEVYLTEALKRYPFPEFSGEKFINEGVVWNRMAKDGLRLHLSNDLLYLCEYQEDGLSARSLELRIQNPRGALLFYSEVLSLDFPGRKLIREAANLVRFALHAGTLPSVYRSLPPRGRRLVLIAFPLGTAAAVRDSFVLRRRSRRPIP